MRASRDLRAHVFKFDLCRELTKFDDLFAALHRMHERRGAQRCARATFIRFIFTGPKANPLKKRLLQGAEKVLNKKQRQILHKGLLYRKYECRGAQGCAGATTHASRAEIVWRYTPSSLLKQRLPGSYRFIKAVEEEPETHLPPVHPLVHNEEGWTGVKSG